MTDDHSPPFDADGEFRLYGDGRFSVPTEYHDNATMHTTHKTVVRHRTAITYYDTAHPDLNPDEQDGVFVAFRHHGEDEWHYYRLVSFPEDEDA